MQQQHSSDEYQNMKEHQIDHQNLINQQNNHNNDDDFYSNGNSYNPSEEEIIDATKYAKYILSSLQFEDVSSALLNIQNCLNILTGDNNIY